MDAVCKKLFFFSCFKVCSQDEDSKSSGEAIYTQVKQMNCLQNHLNSDSSFDTKDSISCDGDSLLSLKDTEVDSEKNFLFSQITENSVSKNITVKNDLNSSCENLLKIKPKLPIDGLSSPKEQNGPGITCVNNAFETISISQPKNNSPSSILKCVLNELDSENEDIMQHLQKEKICKKAPLLNGLLDKGKVIMSGELPSETIIQNGSMSNPPLELNNPEAKTSPTVQLFSNQCSIPVSSNSVSLASSINSVIIPSFNSAIVSSPNTNVTSLSNSNSPGTVLNSTILPSTTFHSNGDNLMQICTGQTTLSGTIEVQPDQKGVVRLHIESPENSNQGSDLSSITDIARTLECASKAISRTNAECNTQVPCCGACETTATVTVITTNTSTLARTGQQIIMVTPALNQPQLHIQSPNIKFRILHSAPRTEESVDVIGFPRINANQINTAKQSTPEIPSNSTTTLKRPSSDLSPTSVLAKKTRIDTKTPLLEASLRLPTPVPSSTASSSVNAKSFQETQPFLLKSTQIENLGSTPKLTYAKAIPVQNVDFPNEREIKTFSGLSSASDNPSLTAPSQVPPRSLSSTQLEYLCEWKDCGL